LVDDERVSKNDEDLSQVDSEEEEVIEIDNDDHTYEMLEAPPTLKKKAARDLARSEHGKKSRVEMDRSKFTYRGLEFRIPSHMLEQVDSFEVTTEAQRAALLDKLKEAARNEFGAVIKEDGQLTELVDEDDCMDYLAIVPYGRVRADAHSVDTVTPSQKSAHDRHLHELRSITPKIEQVVKTVSAIIATGEVGAVVVATLVEEWDEMTTLWGATHKVSTMNINNLVQLTVDGSLEASQIHSVVVNELSCREMHNKSSTSSSSSASRSNRWVYQRGNKGAAEEQLNEVQVNLSDQIRSKLGLMAVVGSEGKKGLVNNNTPSVCVRNLTDADNCLESNEALHSRNQHHFQLVMDETGMRHKQIMEMLYPQAMMFQVEIYYAWQKILHDVIVLIVQKLQMEDVQLGVGTCQLADSITELTETPESIFKYPCVHAGPCESLRILMKLPESIGAAALLILFRSNGRSGHDEINIKFAEILNSHYELEDLSAYFGNLMKIINHLNGLARSRNYFIGGEGDHALLDHKFQIMFCLSKVEACCTRHRLDNNQDANAQQVLKILTEIKDELKKTPDKFPDLQSLITEFSNKLSKTMFRAKPLGSVISSFGASVKFSAGNSTTSSSSASYPNDDDMTKLKSIFNQAGPAVFDSYFELDRSSKQFRIKKKLRHDGHYELMFFDRTIYALIPPELRGALQQLKEISARHHGIILRPKHQITTGVIDTSNGGKGKGKGKGAVRKHNNDRNNNRGVPDNKDDHTKKKGDSGDDTKAEVRKLAAQVATIAQQQQQLINKNAASSSEATGSSSGGGATGNNNK
jgi:hypothetical protein